jgi:hypothetical protein
MEAPKLLNKPPFYAIKLLTALKVFLSYASSFFKKAKLIKSYYPFMRSIKG